MQTPAFGAGQGLVRHLADQDVAEGEDVRPRRPKEILIHQPLDHLVYSLEGRLQGEQARWPEGAPKHGAQLDDPPLFRREQVEARQYRGLDRIRKLVSTSLLGDRADQFAGKE